MLKKLLSIAMAVALILSMSVSALALDLHATANPSLQNEDVGSDYVDGVATPNDAQPTPYIDSDGSFWFEYTSPSGFEEDGYFLWSDSFTITSTSPRINMSVTADDSAYSSKKMYLTLKGKGCGLGKKISWTMDGGEKGYTFSGLTVGETYHFSLSSDYYCSGTGDITNFGEVV